MISSMTGFGSTDGLVGQARVGVELRTVNHRFFNPSLKLPAAFAKWEVEVRELLRQRIARGHVSLTVRYDRETVDAPTINEARFAEYVTQLRTLQDRYGLSSELDVGTVLRLPDVVGTATDEEEGSVEELLALVGRAVDALAQMRRAEGERLADYLRGRLVVMEEALGRIAERAPIRLADQQGRLRAAVTELASGIVEPQRLAQEVAIMADRLDIAEEIDRFRSHLTACRSALDGNGGEPIGKRLGFLVQEMLREANTTGSKANDAQIAADVVLIKEELERIREQVENLE